MSGFVTDMVNRGAALSKKPAPTADIQATTNINVLVPAFGSTASSSTPNVLGPNEQVENDSTAQPRAENDVGGRKNWMSSTVSIGQDQAYNQVCNFLKDDNVGMVGIHGMGGVGKTTLMEKVDEEFLTPSKFKVIWIVVSKTVDMDRIQEAIMGNMDLSFNKGDDTRNRAKKIYRELQKQKVAILFDDIWKCLDFRQLGILGPENLDTKIFKLIFTTRSEVVCEQMESDRLITVQCLGWDDSWALFKRSAKNNDIESCDSRIVELAIKVAKECKGLPLALKVIGGAMACKKRVEEWRHALATLRRCPTDIPDAEECLFTRLKFSFDSLSNPREKACFLYACLYPEDTTLPASLLVECWIGEGILTLNGSYQEAFDEGINIFGTLQAACLFETLHDGGDGGWGLRTRIHDVIRDMGIWIAKSQEMMDLIRLDDGVSRREKTEPHRFSVWYEDAAWPERANSINLTTFIYEIWEGIIFDKKIVHDIDCFTFMSKLRVLKLKGVCFDDTPTSIGELTELRHLDLMRVSPEGLPNEIRNLRKLHMMRFSSEEMIDLPEEIGELLELRKLDVRGIRTVPTEIGNLHKLEELVIYKSEIEELPKTVGQLSELRKLDVNVRNGSLRTLPVDIVKLKKLEELCISSNLEEVPRSIGQLVSLKKLVLKIYGDLELPIEVGNLSKLEILNLGHCIKLIPPCIFRNMHKLRDLTLRIKNIRILSTSLFERLTSLEMLSVDCRQRRVGGKEEDMDDEVAFASFLTQLSALQQLISLQIICFPIKEFQVPPTSNTSCIFPRLSRVLIFRCHNLEKMQVMSPMALPSIRILEILACGSLKHISGLEHLQSLETLEVSGCKNLGEVIGVAGEEADHSPPICFPKLKELKCRDLAQVKSICSDTVSFPSLQDFTCEFCPGLTRLPRGLVKKNGAAPAECDIWGEREWYDKLQWQDRDFKAALDRHILRSSYHRTSSRDLRRRPASSEDDALQPTPFGETPLGTWVTTTRLNDS